MTVIYSWPIWVPIVVILLLDIGASWLGYHLQSLLSRESDHRNGVIVAIRSSAIGLVALLLGFSFSITSSRFSDRQHLVLEESNAIGTCFLRAGLLQEPVRSHIRDALRRYTTLRLANYAAGASPREYARTAREMSGALTDLWNGVSEATRTEEERTLTIFLIPAANDVIDLSTTHFWSNENKMPPEIILLLGIAIAVSGFLIAQSLAETGRRYTGLWLALNLLLMLVLFVVLDLDRPFRGVIRINQSPLVELLETMKT